MEIITDTLGNEVLDKELHMPRGNGTGPNADGPQTGRAAGYCAGFGLPGYLNGTGRGRGAGGGFGRGGGFARGPGRGRGYGAGIGYVGGFGPGSAAPNAELSGQAKWNLERQMEALEGELKMIRQRLSEMGTQETKKDGDVL